MKGLSVLTGIVAFFLFQDSTNGQQRAGDPDAMFGSNGTNYYNYHEPGPALGQCLAIQPDGKILLAGYFGASAGYGDKMAAVRFSADGAIDLSFGTNGLFQIKLTGAGQCRAIALRPDGKILMAGNYGAAEGRRFVVVRVRDNGRLDDTFGMAGITKPFTVGNDNSIESIAVLPDGRVLLAGTVNLNPYQRNFAVVILSSDGQQDLTFGGNGWLQIPFGEGNVISELKTMVVSANGRVTLVGNATAFGSTSTSIAIARIATDGTFDQSFGVGGRALSPIGAGAAQAAAVAEADGTVVVTGGLAEAGRSKFFVAKFRSDGTRDATFGIDGLTSMSIRTGTDDQANGILLQPDGCIVAAGTSAVPDSANIVFAIVRLLPNGSHDLAFGQTGKTTIAFPFNPRDYCRAIAQAPDALIAGGSANNHFAVAKVISYRDADGDGFDDGYEELNGTEPLTATFLPNFELRFPAARDKFHTIEVSLDLQSWTVLETNIRGYGSSLSRFYVYDVPRRFYRVRRVD